MFNLPAELFGDSLEFLGGLLAIYVGLLGLGGIIGLALYILNGIGIMKMSQSLNLRNGWLAFIPFVNIFAFGRVGEQYIKKDNKKSAKFSIWLLVLYILLSILVIVLSVFLIIFILQLIVFAEDAIANDTSMTMDMFKGAIPVIICTFIILAVEITYIILFGICLWRTFSMFNPQNSTLFLVLCIFFPIMVPILLFILRNKEPKVTYEERTPVYINC